MPGPAPIHQIELSEPQLAKLTKIAHSHSAPHAEVVRARIIELAARQPQWTNQQIAAEVGCSDRTVRKWRSRWVATQTLKDAPRPGAPRRFSPTGAGANYRPGL